MSEKKDISRSVRMTQEVYDYIMSYGDKKGFNANLEKAVLFMKKTVPNYQGRIIEYDQKLAELNNEILKRKGIIDHSFTLIQNALDAMVKEIGCPRRE